MQYSIKVSSEPKFKFANLNESLSHLSEESKSSVASSLVTEEDSSGNPLPEEIIKIRQRNKKLQKDLTNSLMNYKSSSRSFIDSPAESEHENIKVENKGKEETGKILEVVAKHEGLKYFLNEIMKLTNDLENAKTELKKNEDEIVNTETENINLKQNLKSFEAEIKSFKEIDSIHTNCSCNII